MYTECTQWTNFILTGGVRGGGGCLSLTVTDLCLTLACCLKYGKYVQMLSVKTDIYSTAVHLYCFRMH